MDTDKEVFSELASSGTVAGKFKRQPEPGEASMVAIAGSLLVVLVVGAASIPQIKGMMAESEANNKSSEAIFRVRQNPIRGVDANRREVAFEDGMPIYDANTMRRITKEGAIIANGRGDTAVIEGGVLAHIIRVNSADSPDYLQWLKNNEALRTSPGV